MIHRTRLSLWITNFVAFNKSGYTKIVSLSQGCRHVLPAGALFPVNNNCRDCPSSSCYNSSFGAQRTFCDGWTCYEESSQHAVGFGCSRDSPRRRGYGYVRNERYRPVDTQTIPRTSFHNTPNCHINIVMGVLSLEPLHWSSLNGQYFPS